MLKFVCSECGGETERNPVLNIHFCRRHGLTSVPAFDREEDEIWAAEKQGVKA